MAPGSLKRNRLDNDRNAKRKKAKKDAKEPKPPPVPQPEKTLPRFERGQADVLRALKKAKGFERQRLSKRINEERKMIKARAKTRKRLGEKALDPTEEGTSEKLQRLEREVDVLKHLDLSVAARVHLASAMLRIKDLAEAVGPLPVFLQRASQVPESQTQQWAKEGVHNVTSSLYGKPMVRESVDKAVRGVCQKLCIDPPEDRKLKTGKKGSKGAQIQEDDDDDEEEEEEQNGIYFGDDDSDLEIIDNVSDYESSEGEGEGNDKKRKRLTRQEKKAKKGTKQKNKEEEEEERQLTYFDALIGEKSEDEDSEKEDTATLRAKYTKALAAAEAEGPIYEEEEDEENGFEDFEGFDDEEDSDDEDNSEGEGSDDADDDSEEEEESDDDESDAPPRKRKAQALAEYNGDVGGGFSRGASSFIPALMMSGYAAVGDDDRDSNDDEDYEEAAARMLAPQRKNRRGQRARQAIWEKKYKEQAKHVKTQEANGGGKGTGKNKAEWDLKRGAVGADDAPRWLRRKQAKEQGWHGRAGGDGGNSAPREKTEKKKADEGPLHPSWEAAKKAKEKSQTAPFEGKKITFD